MCADTARSFTIGNPSQGNSSQGSGSNKKRVSVVQCPACQTKFAVDSMTITSVQSPRFHCSRCDHVFSVSGMDDDTTPVEVPPAPPLSSVSPSTVDFFENATQSSVFGIDEKGEDFAVSVMNDEPFGSSDLPEDAFSFDGVSERRDEKIGEHLFDFGLTGAKSFSDEQMGYGSLSRSESSPLPHKETTDTSIDPLLKKALPKAPPTYKLLLAPSIASVVLFGAIALLSVFSPNTVTTLSNSLIASKESALPSDLYVKKVALKRMILDSGESVSVITGTVKNDSNKLIKELFLEGAIFDPKSKLLEKRKAHLTSALTKSRIQSLTPQMLDDLQNAKPARSFSLKPNQEGEFTIVVPEPQTLNSLPPASFVTRIYSGRVEL